MIAVRIIVIKLILIRKLVLLIIARKLLLIIKFKIILKIIIKMILLIINNFNFKHLIKKERNHF